MLANDILRKIRYSLNLKDKEMIKIFHSVKEEMDHATLRTLLKKEDEEDFQLCTQLLLNSFFDGLIIFYRGAQKSTVPQTRVLDISNNVILRKIRIALAYKDIDMLEVFKLNGRTGLVNGFTIYPYKFVISRCEFKVTRQKNLSGFAMLFG